MSFALKEQTLAGLIGPNGAGKTTIFNALTGLCPVSGGEISFNNQRLTNQPAHTIARYGIARTFQNIRLFKNLTVLDNLRIAYHKNRRYSLLCGLFRSPAFQREEAQITGKARKPLSSRVWQTKPTSSPGTSPTVNSGGWKLPGPSCSLRSSCFWTSRPPA